LLLRDFADQPGDSFEQLGPVRLGPVTADTSVTSSEATRPVTAPSVVTVLPLNTQTTPGKEAHFRHRRHTCELSISPIWKQVRFPPVIND